VGRRSGPTTPGLALSGLALSGLSLVAVPMDTAAAVPAEALEDREAALPLLGVPSSRADALATRPSSPRLGAKILYVNFDGGTLQPCPGSDPRSDCSSLFSGTVLPYRGDESKRAAIVQLLRRRVEDFGITVTTVRPTSGDYDMEMVGDWDGMTPGFAGIAPSGDCWDNLGGEISFALEASETVDGMTEIILQELAHTWGLDHVDSRMDLLYPTTEGQDKRFLDECLPIVELRPDGSTSPTTGTCSHHQLACGSFDLQNSHAELLMIFGESVPDGDPPTVDILHPGEGDVLPTGDFDLVVAVEDDQKPAVVALEVTIESDALSEAITDDGAFASPAQLAFPLDGLPDGGYTIRVSARDESDNERRATVTFVIDAGAGENETDDGSTTDEPGGTSDPEAAASTDDGCGCRSTPTPHPAVLVGLLASWGRRRRGCRVARRRDLGPGRVRAAGPC
jgi:MYXO-CTERM domain-containing protein